MSAVYVAIAIAALAFIFAVLWFGGGARRAKRLTPLAGLALGLVFGSILFGGDPLIGYSLIGVGVALAIVDILLRRRP